MQNNLVAEGLETMTGAAQLLQPHYRSCSCCITAVAAAT